ncbi:MAG: hypothetical protein AAFO07_33110, partial [Bacteroidota bacterium]
SYESEYVTKYSVKRWIQNFNKFRLQCIQVLRFIKFIPKVMLNAIISTTQDLNPTFTVAQSLIGLTMSTIGNSSNNLEEGISQFKAQTEELQLLFPLQSKKGEAMAPVHAISLWNIYQLHPQDERSFNFLKENYTVVCDLTKKIIDAFHIQDTYLLGNEGKVALPEVNACFIQALECLINIGGVIRKDISEVISWYELATYDFNEYLWDDINGHCCAYDFNAHKKLAVDFETNMLVLFSHVLTQDQAEMLFNRIMVNAKALNTTESGLMKVIKLIVDFEGALKYSFDEPGALFAKKINQNFQKLRPNGSTAWNNVLAGLQSYNVIARNIVLSS